MPTVEGCAAGRAVVDGEAFSISARWAGSVRIELRGPIFVALYTVTSSTAMANFMSKGRGLSPVPAAKGFAAGGTTFDGEHFL